MMSKNNENFTIVYYEVRKRLKIGIVEYCILDYLIFLQKRKTLKFRINQIAEKFHISKNTLKKYLLKLKNLYYIYSTKEKDELYRVEPEICSIMEEKDGTYIKIYHDKRKEMEINVLQFGFLSLIYSLSKERPSKIANMGISNIKKILSIRSNENYYSTVKKLIDKNLLEKKGISFYKLPDDIFFWFEEKRSKSAE